MRRGDKWGTDRGRHMKVIHVAVAVSAAALLGASGVALRAQPPVRSARDGIFTEAQDKRGEAVYSRECSTCHGERMKGGEGAPALSGAEFSASWNGQTI